MLQPKDRLEGVPIEQRLEGIPGEELAEHLSAAQLAAFQKKLSSEAPPACGPKGTYTKEDYIRDFVRRHLHVLTTEDRVKSCFIEERLEGIPGEGLAQHLSAAQLAAALQKKLAADAPYGVPTSGRSSGKRITSRID